VNFSRFFSTFSKDSKQPARHSVTSFAPGRANLIGEHTDYNGGLCLPFALELGITCVFTLSRADTSHKAAIEITSENQTLDPVAHHQLVFALQEVQNLVTSSQNHFSEITRSSLPKGPAAYILGSICWYFNQKKVMQEHPKTLLALQEGELLTQIELTSSLPQGAGLSSSAALCLSILWALNDICDQCLTPLVLCELAMKVEHTFAGTQCGLMDQLAIAFSKEDQFLKIDFGSKSDSPSSKLNSPLAKWELIKPHSIFKSYTPLLLNTGVAHSLADTQYNLRRSQCQQALTILQQPLQNKFGLSPASLGELSFHGWKNLIQLLELDEGNNSQAKVTQSALSAGLERFFSKNSQAGPADCRLLAKRASHAIYENKRVVAAAQSLAQGIPENIHKVLADGHVSLDMDYEVSCLELNLAALYLFQAAQDSTPQKLPKILGPRMTGGGFGGSIIALVHKELVDKINDTFLDRRNPYFMATGLNPTLIWSTPKQGARILSRK
jgi:galactokinase